MKRYQIAAGAVAGLLLFVGGYAAGQGAGEDAAAKYPYRSLLNLERGRKFDQVAGKPAYAAMNDTLEAASTDPAALRAVSDQALDEFYHRMEDARGAVQVSEAADEQRLHLQLIQLRQNQRIIRLLEQLAAKK